MEFENAAGAVVTTGRTILIEICKDGRLRSMLSAQSSSTISRTITGLIPLLQAAQTALTNVTAVYTAAPQESLKRQKLPKSIESLEFFRSAGFAGGWFRFRWYNLMESAWQKLFRAHPEDPSDYAQGNSAIKAWLVSCRGFLGRKGRQAVYDKSLNSSRQFIHSLFACNNVARFFCLALS